MDEILRPWEVALLGRKERRRRGVLWAREKRRGLKVTERWVRYFVSIFVFFSEAREKRGGDEWWVVVVLVLVEKVNVGASMEEAWESRVLSWRVG